MSESKETKALLDYQVGDLVQIVSGDYAGALGRILNIKLSRKQDVLVYEVYVKTDRRLYNLRAYQIRFLSRDEKEDK